MARRISFKNGHEGKRLYQYRAGFAIAFMLLLLALLISRLIFLQVYNHEHFTTLSQDNRIRLQPLPPTRGLIFDRNGVLLAENLPAYQLDLIPEDVPDLPATLQSLRQIIMIRDEDIERFKRELKRHRSFDSVPLRYRLTPEELARFAVDRHRFPGVEIHAGLTRYYPYGPLLAHVIGYVGAPDEKDLRHVEESNYLGTTHIGKTGIEAYYENSLHGRTGYQHVEVNAQGRAMRVLTKESPVAGSDLYLSIDIDLQKKAQEALQDFNGAVVAIAPATGEVLAMVSTPSFDPNLFVDGIDRETYKGLNLDRERPLFNRVLHGQYPPGSTIKPFMGIADLDSGQPLSSRGIFCPGYYQFPSSPHRYRDWKHEGHGQTNLHKAIMESCDVYFYQLSLQLGIERMHDYLSRFGFGQRTGVDLPGERAALVPSPAWKRRVQHQPWYRGDTLITAIGQGSMLVTPLQLAQATATLARHGQQLPPHLVHALQDPVSGAYTQPVVTAQGQIQLKDEAYWDEIISAMHDVVQGPRGTARASGANAGYEFAGKTGTAQVFGIAQNAKYNAKQLDKELHDHGLFITFAPLQNPQIAVAVLAEHGGSGSGAAAPIARKVLDAYLLRESHDIQR
jgi:penicillin-binding protein 2